MYNTVVKDLKYLETLLSRNLGLMAISREIELQFQLEEYSEEIIDKIIQCAKKYRDANFKPIVSIKADELKLKTKELEDFIDLEHELGKDGIGLFLSEEGENYTLEQTINAYIKCKDFADFVKSTDSSPFEKYLMIYRFVTNRIYQDSDESVGKSRNLISILNSEEIVCVGYAKLLKFLCNEVGIYCETQVMDVVHEGEDKIGRHENNLIYMKDEKYGIDGYYYADACWDSVKRNERPYLKYTYALVPLSDVEKMQKLHFNFDVTNVLYNEYSETDLIVDAERLKEFAKFMNIPLDSVPLTDAGDDFRQQIAMICKYMDVIFEALKDNRIPSDIFSTDKFKKFPKRFYPEFMVAMAMLKPPRIDLIQKSLDEMKTFYESNGKFDEHTEELGLYECYGYENIYNKLREKEYIDDFFNVWDIENFYEIYHNLPRLWLQIEKMKASSVPVDKITFARAMINSCQAQGLTKQQAVRVTEIAFKRTMASSNDSFNDEANNCFVGEEKLDLAACLGE